MHPLRSIVAVCLGLSLSWAVQAQTVLSIDINERGTDPNTNTMAGFDSFLIDSVGTALLIQTNPSVRTFGALTVTLSGAGANPGYDDRLRATPTNNATFNDGLLLRDFVFARDVATGGLNVTIDGLVPGQSYKARIWSFDTGSPGTRVSDWTANGVLARQGYTFGGGTLPASDASYRFEFVVNASPAGQIAIQGRRLATSVDGAGAASFGVFLNALQLEVSVPEPPTIATQPVGSTVFAGDNVVLSLQAGGSAPFSYQWFRNGSEVTDATNRVLNLFSAQVSDAGTYTCVVMNSSGSATSLGANVIVRAVENIASGLLAYWPFDEITESTPDLSGNMNHLAVINTPSIEFGISGLNLRFDGTTQHLVRTNSGTGGLPVYSYPSYTVAMWVSGVGAGQVDRRIFSEGSTNNNSVLLNIGTHNQGSNGAVNIFIRNDSGTALINHIQTGRPAFDGTWHHVAWVDNNGIGRVYIDGIPDTNTFNYTRSGTFSLNTLSIGAIQRAAVSHWFVGAIDDAAAWRRALSEAEVQYVMANGAIPIRITGVHAGGGNVVITFLTPRPELAHRVEEKSEITGATWSTTSGVGINTISADVLSATFPAPTGGQKFYRVVFQ